jgi:hypothetical protein
MLVNKNYLPFMGVEYDQLVSFPSGNFRVITYQAYNAMGLIGSEHNGIAILNEDDRNVVLDQHKIVSTGYFGVNQDVVQEFKRICNLSKSAFISFVNNHPRARYEI